MFLLLFLVENHHFGNGELPDSYQLARKFFCRAFSVKHASFERARKARYDGLIFSRTYSEVPRKTIQNTFPIMYIQENLCFYISLSTIFFRSLVSYISFDTNMNIKKYIKKYNIVGLNCHSNLERQHAKSIDVGYL